MTPSRLSSPLPAALLLVSALGSLLFGRLLPASAIAFAALFWVGLAGQLRQAGLTWRDALASLPLALVYHLTFALHREAPETMDWLFGSDTRRYFDEALRFFVSPRHIGFAVLTFPLSALTAIGERIGWPRLGYEALTAQAGAIGALSAALLSRLLRQAGATAGLAASAAAAFAVSLAPTAFSSCVETFVPSLLVLLLCLDAAGRLSATARLRELTETALLAALALLVSFENVYLPVVLVVLFAVQRLRRRPPDVRRAGLGAAAAAVIVALVLVVFVPAGHLTSGSGYYRDDWSFGTGVVPSGAGDYLVRFAERYAEPHRLFVPAAWASGVFKTFVASILAQPERPAMDYLRSLDGIRFLSPANVAFGALVLAALGLALPGLARRVRAGLEDRGTFLATVAVAILVVRQPFVTCYAWRATILFAPPSILALWMLVGLGFPEAAESASRGEGARSVYRRRATVGVLVLLALLLAFGNGLYLARAQATAPRSESASLGPLPPSF